MQGHSSCVTFASNPQAAATDLLAVAAKRKDRIMTEDVAAAMGLLQRRISRARDAYLIDRDERALDHLLRNAERIGAPARLARDSCANARKTQRRRAALAPTCHDDDMTEQELRDHAAEIEPGYSKVELARFIECAPFEVRERITLRILLRGGDAADVASFFDTTIPQAQVRISRARGRARALLRAA